MRTVDRRLSKLEHQFGLSKKERLIITVTGYGTLAIDEDACVKILDEAGFLPTSGIAMVNLLDIPDGLDVKETERFLRENGAKICGPRRDRNRGGVSSE
jgi:hypothetical protein